MIPGSNFPTAEIMWDLLYGHPREQQIEALKTWGEMILTATADNIRTRTVQEGYAPYSFTDKFIDEVKTFL